MNLNNYLRRYKWLRNKTYTSGFPARLNKTPVILNKTPIKLDETSVRLNVTPVKLGETQSNLVKLQSNLVKIVEHGKTLNSYALEIYAVLRSVSTGHC